MWEGNFANCVTWNFWCLSSCAVTVTVHSNCTISYTAAGKVMFYETSLMFWTNKLQFSVDFIPLEAVLTVQFQGKVKPVTVQSWRGHVASRLSDIKTISTSELSALRPGCLIPQEILLVLISFRRWVNQYFTVRHEELSQRNTLINPSGIESTTFRIVAQCIKQMRYILIHGKMGEGGGVNLLCLFNRNMRYRVHKGCQ
jgi:hypothetical protein